MATTNSKQEFTPENITGLGKNEIFVFGSNLQGQHIGGAARVARERFGAEVGCGVGRQGQSYAIPTMHGGVESIKPYVDEFINYAQAHKDLKFYVTRIGCGIAGFKDEQMAPLFDKAFDLPNIVLPETFWHIINHQRQLASETSGMTFNYVPIRFYDEDLAKMEEMSDAQKMEYVIGLKKAHKYIIEHGCPSVENDDYVLNTTRTGHHKIAITERSIAIVAGSKLYTDCYKWGLDLGQEVLSVVAKDGCAKDYPYGQFIVLLNDGTIREIWSESHIKTPSTDKAYCSIASGCNGLVFGLDKDGRVAVFNAESNPSVAAEVAKWNDIKQIGAGPLHVVGLRKDGTIVAAGKASACEPLRQWQNISKIYVSKMSPIFGKENALTFGIDEPYGWLHVDGDLWPKSDEFKKRISAQYNVTDVIENGYCVWVRTTDRITRAITYYAPINYHDEIQFVQKHPSFRYYDAYGDIQVLVDKDGEFHVLNQNVEVRWWSLHLPI